MEEVGCYDFLNQNDDYRAYGVSKPDFSYVGDGSHELVKGRTFTESELSDDLSHEIPVIISQKLAKSEHFQIGSAFSLHHSTYYERFNSVAHSELLPYEDFTFKVIGIFELTEEYFCDTKLILPLRVVNRLWEINLTASDNYRKEHDPNHPQLSWTLEQKAEIKMANTIFQLKEATDLRKFEAEANEILAPDHKIQLTGVLP